MSIVPKSENMSELTPGALAHELANLVQALSGNLELIAARTADEHALRYIANARAAAKQLEELTRKLREA
jgi:signal transduction histidine kinase